MKPLSKKIRKISLIISLVAFIIIGPIVLAYSLGYRFNELEEKFGLVRTGGIYVHSDVGNAEIYINTEYYKSTGNFLRNVFIQNMKVDEDHLIEVQKNNYHNWAKKLPVYEGYVTEARTLLVPIEIKKDAIFPFVNISGIGTTTDDAETIYNPEYKDLEILFGLASSTIDTEVSLINEINGKLKINANESSSTTSGLATSSVEVPDYFIKLGIENPEELDNLIIDNDELAWIESGDISINWIGSIDQIPYYFCDFKDCVNKIELDWETDISKFAFMPNRKDVLLVLNKEGLWAAEVDDRSSRNIFPIYSGEDLDFMISQKNKIVVLDNEIFYELDF